MQLSSYGACVLTWCLKEAHVVCMDLHENFCHFCSLRNRILDTIRRKSGVYEYPEVSSSNCNVLWYDILTLSFQLILKQDISNFSRLLELPLPVTPTPTEILKMRELSVVRYVTPLTVVRTENAVWGGTSSLSTRKSRRKSVSSAANDFLESTL